LPPVIPSKALAKNNTINGRVITKAPKILELMLMICETGKNNAIRKIIQPAKVPALLNKSIFFFHKYQTIFLILELQSAEMQDKLQILYHKQ